MIASARRKQGMHQGHALRVALLVGLAVAAVVVVFACWSPIGQKPSYHDFADQTPHLGIPHCLNVISNVPFVAVGLSGVLFLVLGKGGMQPGPVQFRAEWWSYLLLFVGVGITGFGSTYYHLHPDNQRLLWDRLPMALAFMSLLAAVISERVGPRVGGVLLVPLVAVGLGSVVYWHLTEQAGQGDLRPYFIVQGYPIAAIPLLLLLFPARYTRTLDLFIAVAWYVLAKVCESLDRTIYGWGEIISGHTLKHLFGAVGAYWVLRMLWLRKPISWKMGARPSVE